jgi:hypothetical protein
VRLAATAQPPAVLGDRAALAENGEATESTTASAPAATDVRVDAVQVAQDTRSAEAVQAGVHPSIDVQVSDPLTESPLPADLPSIVTLGGADVPLGPDGVQTSGARTFAQLLLVRAHDRDPDLADDPSLRQIAEDVLTNQLALARLTGAPRPARLVQGSVVVQIEVVGPLSETPAATLRLPSSTRVSEVGLAVGVVQRAEPGYLPDLVAVAAVAYR